MIPNRYSQRTETAELDRIDWKIIEELQQDARLSWAELGRRVGLTPNAFTGSRNMVSSAAFTLTSAWSGWACPSRYSCASPWQAPNRWCAPFSST
jgi:hypothetical protein